MDRAGDLLDALVEEAEGRRVGQHQGGRSLGHSRPQVGQVDVAARVGRDAYERVAGHRHARGIGAVRGVGHDHLVALLAAVGEVRACQQEPEELPLGARSGLKRDRIEAGDLGESSLEPPHELERALTGVDLLGRVQTPKSRQRGEPLVDARVVLHRARPERIEARVDSERPRRELREVADELRLGQLGQARRRPAPQLARQLAGFEVMTRQRGRPPARLRFLVEKLHPTPPATPAGERVAPARSWHGFVLNRHDPRLFGAPLPAIVGAGWRVSPPPGWGV